MIFIYLHCFLNRFGPNLVKLEICSFAYFQMSEWKYHVISSHYQTNTCLLCEYIFNYALKSDDDRQN